MLQLQMVFIPLLVKFNDESIPDVVRVAGEVWATDNVGEKIRIVDYVSGIIHPEPQGNDAYGLALIIQSSDVPNVGRFVSVNFRITDLSLLDTGVGIMVGDREVLVTGLPD